MAQAAQAERLFIAVAKRTPMREVEKVQAVADKGFENCVHGRTGSRRQVLLMDAETLAELDLTPGQIRENITTRGLALTDLAPLQRLRIGDAVLEVSVACDPCEQMDRIRMGLQEELQGRRGMLCRVVEGGLIRRGASIERLSSSAETDK